MSGNGVINFYQGAERDANLRALKTQLERALEEAQRNAQQLGSLGATAQGIEEGAEPTVTVTQDENGIHIHFGIPAGPQGNAFKFEDFTPEQLEQITGFSPVVSLEQTAEGLKVTVQNKDGVDSEVIPAMKFETDETLTLEGGILSVNRAEKVEEDNTLPITSAAVYAEVGNINALLATI